MNGENKENEMDDGLNNIINNMSLPGLLPSSISTFIHPPSVAEKRLRSFSDELQSADDDRARHLDRTRVNKINSDYGKYEENRQQLAIQSSFSFALRCIIRNVSAGFLPHESFIYFLICFFRNIPYFSLSDTFSSYCTSDGSPRRL